MEQSDRDRELSRSYRRTVFYEKDWRNYRSIARFQRNMEGLLTSRIARGLLPPLSYVFLSSCAVCYYETLLESGALEAVAPWAPDLAVSPSGPFSISTFALSLLLVFRTNSSYHRWWEACGALNSIVSSCLQLGRQAVQRLPSDADAPARAALLRWLAAFPLVLMAHVREEEEEELPPPLQGVLLPHEADLLLAAPSRPQAALQVIGSLIGRTSLTPDSKTRLDETVKNLQAGLLACQKIKRTPLPLSYSRLASRFLIVWISALPFCSWQLLGWATVPVDLLLSFFLLAVEELGVQVEEPLTLIALEYWCDVVKEGLQQMEAQHAAIEAMELPPPAPAPAEAAGAAEAGKGTVAVGPAAAGVAEAGTAAAAAATAAPLLVGGVSRQGDGSSSSGASSGSHGVGRQDMGSSMAGAVLGAAVAAAVSAGAAADGGAAGAGSSSTSGGCGAGNLGVGAAGAGCGGNAGAAA